METQEEDMATSEENWKVANIVFGKLTSINRDKRTVDIESKNYDDDDWYTTCYTWAGFNSPKLDCLGQDHELTILSDGHVHSINDPQGLVHKFTCKH